MKFFLTLTLLFLPFQAIAQENAPKFGFPLACSLGKTCWTLNYTDTTPDGDGQMVDPGCLNRTYDGHTGTDFVILDERAMKRGVDVIAAADGRVVDTRDEIADLWLNTAQLAALKKTPEACGNRVFIDHGNKWVSKYCHMKRDSIEVKPGQTVRKGTKIGEVGLSGNTSFPHLHFEIEWNGRIIDPYTGANILYPCGRSAASLWDSSAKLFYEPLTIVQSGFDINKPSLGLLDRGMKIQNVLQVGNVTALYYYVLFNGARKGDLVALSVTGPNGKGLMTHVFTQDRPNGRQFYHVGHKADKVPLDKGIYKGNVVITRIYADGTKQEWTKSNSIEVR